MQNIFGAKKEKTDTESPLCGIFLSVVKSDKSGKGIAIGALTCYIVYIAVTFVS